MFACYKKISLIYPTAKHRSKDRYSLIWAVLPLCEKFFFLSTIPKVHRTPCGLRFYFIKIYSKINLMILIIHYKYYYSFYKLS